MRNRVVNLKVSSKKSVSAHFSLIPEKNSKCASGLKVSHKKKDFFFCDFSHYSDGLAENSQNISAIPKVYQVFRFGRNFVIIKLSDMVYVTQKIFQIVLLEKN